MLNIAQLDDAVDSLKISFSERKEDFTRQMISKYTFTNVPPLPDTSEAENKAVESFESKRLQLSKADDFSHMKDTLLLNIEGPTRSQVVQNALRIARSNKAYFQNTGAEFHWWKQITARHLLEWHKKFSVSFTCLVLFFIGAPLGAIIRKGGMGMPVVVSVFIFLIYHVTSYSFEKLGRELVWSPFAAMWVANFYLLPFGIFLTYKSANDSAIFNKELYLKPIKFVSNIFVKLFTRKS